MYIHEPTLMGTDRLMLTSWMTRLGINARTIDKRGTKVFNGQADGLQPRTLELFQSFGFDQKVVAEAQLLHDMVSWVSQSLRYSGTSLWM